MSLNEELPPSRFTRYCAKTGRILKSDFRRSKPKSYQAIGAIRGTVKGKAYRYLHGKIKPSQVRAERLKVKYWHSRRYQPQTSKVS